MKKIFFSFWLLLALGTVTVVFNSCSKNDDPKQDTLTVDKGVVINGVKWATRNVAAPGFFAANPEDPGMFYQWNRKKAWPVTGAVTGWDSSYPTGTTWEQANDPSPAGWRVPTFAEIQSLLDTTYVSNGWTTENGVNGQKFIDKATGNSIFLPAAGGRNDEDGSLYYVGANGHYWSSTVSNDLIYDNYYAYYLNFYVNDAYLWSGINRSGGLSVRAVAE